MKRLLLPLAAVAIAALLLPAGVRPAYACSAGPDFDAVAESDVIVAGQITGWRERADIPSPFEQAPEKSAPEAPFLVIGVQLEVERIFKGDAPAVLEIVDVASLEPHTHRWLGASGSCGAFDFDPTGMYAIMGLKRGEDGSLRSNRLLTFFMGSAPQGELYEDALARLSSLGPGALPPTGSAPPAGEPGAGVSWLPIITGSSLAAALAAASAALLRRRIMGRG